MGEREKLEFRELIEELVRQHGGNQRAAARSAGLSSALLSQTLRGRGPDDPRADTIQKAVTALQATGSDFLVREGGVAYGDRFARLADWLRGLAAIAPEKVDSIFSVARALGFKDGP